MNWIAFLLIFESILVFERTAFATYSPQAIITDASTGATANVENDQSLKVDNSSHVQPSSQSGVWTTGRTWTLSNTTDSCSAYQGGAWTVGVTQGTNPWIVAFGSTPTINIGNFPSTQAVTQSGSWSVTANAGTNLNTSLLSTAANQTSTQSAPGTPQTTVISIQGNSSGIAVPVSAASLPLPSNAATSTNQVTANTSLSSIVTNTTGLALANQFPSTLGAKTTANSTAVNIASDQTVAVSVASLPLPSGGATSANQTNGAQKTQVTVSASPINANATLSARQTVTVTESTVSAPSNAVGVILECESLNAVNLRWGFSNSGGAILSSTLGMLCEPGRSESLPVGTGTVLHMIATAAGSNFMDVQWVLSQ